MKSGSSDGTEDSVVDESSTKYGQLPVTVANLWTSAQRKSNSIHEISYRACFKAELPEFFITRYSNDGDVVYDPFMGRGTTPVEAALNRRIPFGVDINPLSVIFALPRLAPPSVDEVRKRLIEIPMESALHPDIDLTMFFHERTESEIMSVRKYLSDRRKDEAEDKVDRFIRMVATNRLTGHSSGFFSVYTLPPNQAATQESQVRINRRLGQVPVYKDVKSIILRKTKSLLRDIDNQSLNTLRDYGKKALLGVLDARDTSSLIKDGTVSLTVTSPPFLNIVQYKLDNWLRLWFNGIDLSDRKREPFVTSNMSQWSEFTGEVFTDIYRITKAGGRVAFEVGEIRNGSLKLEEYVLEAGKKAGFDVERLFINSQKFTKTSNIWGVKNNRDGTNTNRIVLFRKGG
ncbi:MAG TPA: DNA methyltransferase [Thermoplasmataceae archaeon]|nr:DNA methyltransferase [Thermoplasmataceae archaeon]